MFSATNTLVRARNHGFRKPNSNHYYREVYLKSDHWKFLREEKLRISPECQKCGIYSNLDVHHKEYRGLYDVRISDLVTLCRKCHEIEHKTNRREKKKKRNPNFKVKRFNKTLKQKFKENKYDTGQRINRILRNLIINKQFDLFKIFIKLFIQYYEDEMKINLQLKREKTFNTYISIHY